MHFLGLEKSAVSCGLDIPHTENSGGNCSVVGLQVASSKGKSSVYLFTTFGTLILPSAESMHAGHVG